MARMREDFIGSEIVSILWIVPREPDVMIQKRVQLGCITFHPDYTIIRLLHVFHFKSFFGIKSHMIRKQVKYH